MKLPKLIKNSAIYTFVQFLQKGVGFFLLPLYTAKLTPADYGVLNIVTSFSSIMSILILLGLQGAATRFHFQNTEEAYRKELWGTITTFVLYISIIVSALLLVFHKFLIDPLIGNIPFYPYILLGIINTLLSPLYLFFQTYLNTRQEASRYGINMFLNFLVNTGLIILFLMVQGKGAESVLLANIFTSLIFLIYVLAYFIPRIKMGINTSALKQSLQYSLPLVPHLISNASAGMLDRFFINGIRNESETGLYSVGNQFGSIVHTVTNAVHSAFSPWFMQNVIENSGRNIETVERFGLFSAFIYSSLALCISLFAPEALQIMVTDSFRGVWTLIPLLCFAYVFQGFYLLFITVLFIKDTGFVFIVSFSALIANVLLNLLLIPHWGYIGAGIACLLSFLVKSIVALIIGMIKVRTIRYPWLKMYVIVFLAFILTFVNYLLVEASFIASLGIKVIVVLGIVFPIYLRYRDFIKSALFHKRG